MQTEFALSRDNHLLHQYYTLREHCFRRELGLPGFDGSEEEQDRQGQILLILLGGECLGGARISGRVALPSQAGLLDLETDTCCMWERFVVDPRVRTMHLIREFCRHLIEASVELGFQYAMVLSSLRNARFYRRCHAALGVDFRIHRPVPHCAKGSFAGLEHYLSVSYLIDAQEVRMAV